MKKADNPSLYRYGSPRRDGEGLRLGVTRYVPRGVRKADWSRHGYFDFWLPLLSPAPETLQSYVHGKITFRAFAARYRAEMKHRESAQVIELLAGISLFVPISLGCFCEDESCCHRSLLQQLIFHAARGKRHARGQPAAETLLKYASPVCFADLSGE